MLTEEEYDRRWRRYGVIAKVLASLFAMALVTGFVYGPGWFRGIALVFVVVIAVGLLGEDNEREQEEADMEYRRMYGTNPPAPEKPKPWKSWNV